jgi:aldose 1-epimerase
MTVSRLFFKAQPGNADEHWSRAAAIFASILLFLVLIQGPADPLSAPRTVVHSNNRKMPAIVLKNKNGMEVTILQTGAVIQNIILPAELDPEGKLVDVALGFDELEPYQDGTSPYFGALVGRVANRIANAQFELNDKIYKLAANNGPNCLHGGITGFSRVTWKVSDQGNNDHGQYVELQYHSPDGDEGFPGSVTATVIYTLMTNSNTLKVEMKATTDAPTPINLAQHTYFNLAGHSNGDILNHTLELVADHWTPVDEVQIPTGEILPVENSPMDFYSEGKPRRVGERIQEVPGGEPKGYDHNFVLFGLGPNAKEKVKHGMAYKEPKLAATLIDPGSGRGMRLYTTAPGIQFYSGNFLDGTICGKQGTTYQRHAGLCLETQGWPDAINQKKFPDIVIHPGEEYRHIVEYEFYSV